MFSESLDCGTAGHEGMYDGADHTLTQNPVLSPEQTSVTHQTTQQNTIQNDTIQHNTTQHDTIQYNTTQYNSAVQCNTAPYNTKQDKTGQDKTMQNNELHEDVFNTGPLAAQNGYGWITCPSTLW